MANDEPLPTPAPRVSFGDAPSRSSVPKPETSSRQWRATAPSGVAEQVAAANQSSKESEASERSPAPPATEAKQQPASEKLDYTPLASRFKDLRR